jgi:hypothetical protein
MGDPLIRYNLLPKRKGRKGDGQYVQMASDSDEATEGRRDQGYSQSVRGFEEYGSEVFEVI